VLVPRLGERRVGALPLDGEDRDAEQGEDGAADQHQMGGAPEGDVLSEEPVPDVVEGKADQRERAAGADQDAAQGRPPVPAEPDRDAARPLFRQHHGDEARGEDPEEAGEDQVVGGVGERAGVAPVVDVQGHVPVHPDQGDDQRGRRHGRGDGRPARGEEDALEAVGEAPHPEDAAGAMPEARVEQGGGDDRRGDGGDHDLLELGATGRRRLCGEIEEREAHGSRPLIEARVRLPATKIVYPARRYLVRGYIAVSRIT
jgi:hypothetical protein